MTLNVVLSNNPRYSLLDEKRSLILYGRFLSPEESIISKLTESLGDNDFFRLLRGIETTSDLFFVI